MFCENITVNKQEMHSLTGGCRGDGLPVGCKLMFFHDFFQLATVQGGRGGGVAAGSRLLHLYENLTNIGRIRQTCVASNSRVNEMIQVGKADPIFVPIATECLF